jgi:ketosteroid isomerase-like protein
MRVPTVTCRGLISQSSKDVNFESMTCDDYRVRVYGNTAVMNHRTVLKGRYKGEDFGMTYRTTHVWHKRGGRWQVVVRECGRKEQTNGDG